MALNKVYNTPGTIIYYIYIVWSKFQTQVKT